MEKQNQNGENKQVLCHSGMGMGTDARNPVYTLGQPVKPLPTSQNGHGTQAIIHGGAWPQD